MKARPILFSAPMIRALLAGTKTQTRRIMKPQPHPNGFIASTGEILTDNDYLPPAAMLLTVGKGRNRYTTSNYEGWESACPYGTPGELLWVRETATMADKADDGFVYEHPVYLADITDSYGLAFVTADGPRYVEQLKWITSIHMPRAWSRLTLRITEVRVQRLRDISRGDAMAEGCPFANMAAGPDPREWYAELWDEINGPGSWDANPWVWALTFEVIKQNVDAVLADKETA